MQTFVRTEHNSYAQAVIVVEVISIDDEQDIRDMYHPDFVAQLIDVSKLDSTPQQWWVYKNDTFTPPGA